MSSSCYTGLGFRVFVFQVLQSSPYPTKTAPLFLAPAGAMSAFAQDNSQTELIGREDCGASKATRIKAAWRSETRGNSVNRTEAAALECLGPPSYSTINPDRATALQSQNPPRHSVSNRPFL